MRGTRIWPQNGRKRPGTIFRYFLHEPKKCYGCWTNFCNTRLKIHAQFRKSTRRYATALRAAANFVRRLCPVFARGFAKWRVNFQASVAIICSTSVCRPIFWKHTPKFKPWKKVNKTSEARPPPFVDMAFCLHFVCCII